MNNDVKPCGNGDFEVQPPQQRPQHTWEANPNYLEDEARARGETLAPPPTPTPTPAPKPFVCGSDLIVEGNLTVKGYTTVNGDVSTVVGGTSASATTPKFTTVQEQNRIYKFPSGGTVTLNGVLSINVSKSGTHRINTTDGKKHIIPPGWIHIEFDAAAWTF